MSREFYSTGGHRPEKPPASAVAKMVFQVTDMAGGRLVTNTPAELDAVRRLVADQPNVLELLQMLGLEPYDSVVLEYAKCGSIRRYDLGCRCEPCRAALGRKMAGQKRRKQLGLNNVSTHNRCGYTRGCRCITCREAEGEFQRNRVRSVRSHGVGGYRAGCRCQTCRGANAQASRSYRARRRAAA